MPGWRNCARMNLLVERFKTSPLPSLLYRAHLGWLRLRPPKTFGVRTVVVADDGRVLLVRHCYRPGWFLPGGGVKRFETAEAAAIRETREEAGVEVERLDRLVGLYPNFSAVRSDHVALFLAGPWRTVGARSIEIAESGFFDLDDLPDGTTPATRRRLGELFRGDPPVDFW